MRLTALLLLTVTAAASAVSEPVVFGEREYIYCAGERVDVGTYSAPMATDWNLDGRKDLIVGAFEYGNIRYYPNVGTSSEPVFETWSYLMDGMYPISVWWG